MAVVRGSLYARPYLARCQDGRGTVCRICRSAAGRAEVPRASPEKETPMQTVHPPFLSRVACFAPALEEQFLQAAGEPSFRSEKIRFPETCCSGVHSPCSGGMRRGEE